MPRSHPPTSVFAGDDKSKEQNNMSCWWHGKEETNRLPLLQVRVIKGWHLNLWKETPAQAEGRGGRGAEWRGDKDKDCVHYECMAICSINPMVQLMHSGNKRRVEGRNVPRVTLLYTLLNLTAMDVALGGRATVERVKGKSRSWCFALGHTCTLSWESVASFSVSFSCFTGTDHLRV